jgi:O-glycosyl hydrolase
VYAAIDAANHNRLVIVAINKATTAKTTAVKVTGEQVFGHAKTYTLTGASSTPKAGATLTSTAQNAFLYTMPAQSVTVIVPTT